MAGFRTFPTFHSFLLRWSIAITGPWAGVGVPPPPDAIWDGWKSRCGRGLSHFTLHLLYKGQFWVCPILLIGCLSGVVARPRPPSGALIGRVVISASSVVSTAPAPKGDGRWESVCTRRWGGVAEQWDSRWRLGCGVQSSTGHRSSSIGIKSDALIWMVALTNVDFRSGPWQSRVGHYSEWYLRLNDVFAIF